jgi:hypothetical protein
MKNHQLHIMRRKQRRAFREVSGFAYMCAAAVRRHKENVAQMQRDLDFESGGLPVEKRVTVLEFGRAMGKTEAMRRVATADLRSL